MVLVNSSGNANFSPISFHAFKGINIKHLILNDAKAYLNVIFAIY